MARVCERVRLAGPSYAGGGLRCSCSWRAGCGCWGARHPRAGHPRSCGSVGGARTRARVLGRSDVSRWGNWGVQRRRGTWLPRARRGVRPFLHPRSRGSVNGACARARMPGRSVVNRWGKWSVRGRRRGTWLPRARCGVRSAPHPQSLGGPEIVDFRSAPHPQSLCGPEIFDFRAQWVQLAGLVWCDGVNECTQLRVVLGSSVVGLAGDFGLQVLVGTHDFVLVGELRVGDPFVLELPGTRYALPVSDPVREPVEAVVVRRTAHVPALSCA